MTRTTDLTPPDLTPPDLTDAPDPIRTAPSGVTRTAPGEAFGPDAREQAAARRAAEEQSALDRLAAPPAPRRPRNWKKWRARLVVLVMLGGAVAGGRELVESRTVALAQFDLGTVTLSAQPIPVETAQTGQVSSVDVQAQQHVRAGQRLGAIVVTSTTGAGREVQRKVTLTAPSDGIVSGDPVPVGSALQPGEPFVQLYDPSKLTLDAAVKVGDLPQLSEGMIATLHADGVPQPIRAVVRRVVPRMSQPGSLPSSQDRMEVVLVPQQPSQVAGLVPGMHFTGTVDTGTGPAHAGSVLHVGS